MLPRGALRTKWLTALRQVRKTRRPRARRKDRRGHSCSAVALGGRPPQGSAEWFDRGHPGGTDAPPDPTGSHGRDGCHENLPGLHEDALACPYPTAENADL